MTKLSIGVVGAGRVGAVLAAPLLSVIESWRVWRSDPDRQPF